jgi:peptide/nickel transport system permease protein
MSLSLLGKLWILGLATWALLIPTSSINLEALLLPPRPEAWLGNDAFGRDLAAALGESIRRSLGFALVASISALTAGSLLGGLLGSLKGRPRFLAERVLDFTLAFPPFLLALSVQAILGSGWSTLLLSVAFGLFPSTVRFVAVKAKEVSLSEYVTAAKALGGKKQGIFWRHYRPELADHLLLKLPSLFAQALLLEATLSFLNLGVSPGVLSWGTLLTQAKDYLIEAPHIAWVSGIPLVLTLLALQAAISRAAADTPKL